MTVAEAITALTALGALVFTGLSLNATRDQVAAAHRQNAVAEQGQLTDRYSRSVEQLDRTGPDHLQGRLGAIYALERLAKDSPRDQPTIVEVLSAFVRTNRARASSDSHVSKCPEPVALPPDAKAALTVLGRRDTGQDKGARTDLTSACLNGLDLRNLPLHNVDLSFSDLHGSILNGTGYRNLRLRRANLEKADLGRADLTSIADLTGANLRGADLSGALLREADLEKADLSGAVLTRADLSKARLVFADFRGANLTDAQCIGADLSSADLSGAVLSRTLLRDANLRAAALRSADLRGANLTGALHNDDTDVRDALTDPSTVDKWW
ncbi:hypothetical protein GCM10010178_33850 [Lentzea flava]|uniref:Pentapeptide repeat-containing protein n=2 Tax=Lentzea flava TaxID=103732 RepID=A0ABQ2UKA4_9PSEU|nr:Uncharacterized protein YjbI, contains pentapeptide repeats [Lentzea flava]GGU38738.1 hypothetical protein GCM10010178_33850 [Lentzea flava]